MDDEKEVAGFSTRAVHGRHDRPGAGQPVVQPVYQSATFFTDALPAGEVLYTRYGTNPNHIALGEKLAALEGADAAIVLDGARIVQRGTPAELEARTGEFASLFGVAAAPTLPD